MKTAKIMAALSVLAAFNGTANAQVSPFVSAQIDAAVKPCSDVAGATAGLPDAQAKTIATAALPVCYNALNTLDEFERTNGAGLSAEERNYFYFVGGMTIWMTAASETIRNDGRVSLAICNQVKSAETAWGNIDAPFNSQLVVDMQNNDIRKMLVPVCNSAAAAN